MNIPVAIHTMYIHEVGYYLAILVDDLLSLPVNDDPQVIVFGLN